MQQHFAELKSVLTAKDIQLEEFKQQHKKSVEKLGDQLTHLEAEASQMKAQLAEMDAQTRQQKSLPTAQQSRSESNNKHSFELEEENASVLRQGKLKIPRSCADLKTIGQPSSGINLIIGAKYIETVLCDFRKQPNDPSFQTFIGYAEIKSSPTYFYVQKNRSFDKKNTPLPFEVAQVNIGGAMDLPSGKFTAPRAGIYFFSFSGLVQFPESSTLVFSYGARLLLNGKEVGRGWVEEANTKATQNSPLTLQSTLNLQAGDKVWVELTAWESYGEYLYDDPSHYTHFSGLLLSEEISRSIKTA
ncbi:uncharacterized protein LOC124327568 isoform X2 [Daphnia pulicaria]|nr:uncharacterized protein LOC124327545 isoform X2 [Daphnia pulicaria]XP_046642480.1 uncharacterized protein LOC124327545 isoform X2 [Daphnia pulicaria]XP_046642500.1 uncharacterized protein LOC124327568 isoform X2 [Daphnia pulicaria]XP_046642509.1 uncharacterized protein LOC124327568 isoform X2 [Daphnia pulicaria]